MRKLLFLLVVGLAAFAAGPAAAAIEVTITSPASAAHVGDIGTVVPVQATASATSGIYGVQLNVDGQPYPNAATWDSTPTGQYLYEIDWNTTGLAAGTHLLSVTAMDWSVPFPEGATQESDPITVDVGPAFPTISLSAPASFTFVHGSSVPVAAAFTSAANPPIVQLSADGSSLATTLGSGTATATWNSTSVSDGAHTIAASIVDARGKSASTSATVTVDNTPPSTFIVTPAANSFFTDSLAATAHASDAYGVASVQFAIDGVPAGGALTSPDGGSGFNYSSTLSLASLTSGAHQLTAVATDMAGNVSTTAPVTFSIGIAPPAVSISIPPDWTFAHGTVSVVANVTGGAQPDSVQLYVDGVATGSPVTASPYTFSWDTTKVADGSHTLVATVTDAQGRTASSPTIHQTVDNTAPSTFVIAPPAGSFFQGSMPVSAHASDAYGVASVQFAIDGAPVSSPLTAPDGGSGYTYSATLSLAGLTNGAHSLTSIATDGAGNTTTSAPVSFTIGTGPATVVVTTPPDWSLASKIVPVTATVTGGSPPFTVTLLVDGVATTIVPTVAGSTYTFGWDTTTLSSGTHTIQVSVKGSDNLTASSAVLHETVDNTAPTAVMYQPTLLPGYTYARSNGPTTLQVHASDAYGVKSVQFTVDGAPVGALLTAPDSGQQYLYSLSFDTSTLAPGMHSISAVVTDQAGNITTATPISLKSGPLVYVPVLNYHGIEGPLDTAPDVYDQTAAEADGQLAYLQANGYQSITVEQYQTWLTSGALPAGVTKPVLITIDDGLTDELAWDPLLQKYGFKAVLYAVTGFADNTTPGSNDPTGNMSWAQLQAFAANGRWEIGFHAGQYGHGDYSETANTIKLSSTQTQSYATTCWTYYNCLGTITTTTGTGRNKKTTTAPETPAQFESQVSAEITAGITELKAKIPSASLISWACPWNACGQWTNFYNDASGTVQSWFPGFAASKFPIVFMQTDPITYGLASGSVGPLNGDNRRYRFEVHTDTTIAQFATALTDPAFANN